MLRRISTFAFILSALSASGQTDTVPSGFSRPLEWHVGVEAGGGLVPGTSAYLRGLNPLHRPIDAAISGDIRTDFSFSPSTREGLMYKGLYQGLGIGANTFFANSLIGSPVSAYVYQGAEIVRFNQRLWLGYEWQFGAAFGWRHEADPADESFKPVSTPVTAHMGLGLKFHYFLNQYWQLSLGLSARHFSNGNTSIPNTGVNLIGASVGITYTLSPARDPRPVCFDIADNGNCRLWHLDITAFGAWRKRIISLGTLPEYELCPGKFGVLGLQIYPLRALNRWVAVGPSLDLKWDESAGLQPYWLEGTHGDEMKFVRPPFAKQLSAGVSAHAELTMPIFSVNAGIGYDLLCPHGDVRFYQSLALKAFITNTIFLNVGYRLGDFSVPQNLMLGVGVRL